MNKIFLSILIYFCLITSYAQERYAYLPSKTIFQTSHEKIIIKYKNGLKKDELRKFISDTLSLNQSNKKWDIFTLKNSNRNERSLKEILTELRKDPDVLYANPFLIYKDGTLQGLTNQITMALILSANPALTRTEATNSSSRVRCIRIWKQRRPFR